MNKQGALVNGKVVGGIEWTKTVHADGSESQGYTWNPVGGCQHACRWVMPDGTVAVCYAETTAKVMKSAYPQGFEHHYWRPHMLNHPTGIKKPARIFMDSMSDLMGRWVPAEQITAVFDACRKSPQHTFQLLTKNAPRLNEFDFPSNVWVGVSAPPSLMFGKPLTPFQQEQMVRRQLGILDSITVPVRWMSIEPLSFDIAEIFDGWKIVHGGKLPIEWAVIGAASNCPRHYQPNPEHVEKLHQCLRSAGVAIFHKGNLKWDPHLEEFPNT